MGKQNFQTDVHRASLSFSDEMFPWATRRTFIKAPTSYYEMGHSVPAHQERPAQRPPEEEEVARLPGWLAGWPGPTVTHHVTGLIMPLSTSHSVNT